MIINDSDAVARLNSPMNLMNKLKQLSNNNGNKKNSAMSLFGIGRPTADSIKQITEEKLIEEVTVKFNPFSTKDESSTSLLPLSASLHQDHPQIPIFEPLPERLDDILGNSESQIKLGLAHDRALDLLNRSVEMLATKLDDVSPAKLPAVISAASKTVESIRRERAESSKNNKDQSVHFHFYTPEQRKMSDYEVID